MDVVVVDVVEVVVVDVVELVVVEEVDVVTVTVVTVDDVIVVVVVVGDQAATASAMTVPEPITIRAPTMNRDAIIYARFPHLPPFGFWGSWASTSSSMIPESLLIDGY